MANITKKLSDFPLVVSPKNRPTVEKAISEYEAEKDGQSNSAIISAAIKMFRSYFKRSSLRIKEEANLTDEQIQAVNDITLEEFGYARHVLEDADEATEGTPELNHIISVKKSKFIEYEKVYIVGYKANHGEQPNNLPSGKNTGYEQLAYQYIECAKATKETEPTQSSLQAHTEISQATWSRAFKEQKLWDFISNISFKEIDLLNSEINDIERAMHDLKMKRDQKVEEKGLLLGVNSKASDRTEYFNAKQLRDKEMPLLDMGLEKNMAMAPSIEESFDNDLELKSLSKQKLLDIIVKKSPTVKIHDFDKFSKEQLLNIAVAMYGIE